MKGRQSVMIDINRRRCVSQQESNTMSAMQAVLASLARAGEADPALGPLRL